ncbi:aldehyde dehydrogenase family protein [Streptomyces cinerochromogenes]|uniref:Aldehyde dehydrogenase family protein n=1 Tax=Streptomyces cinerochromogenes TaxID=66422 RepID=A0ABW7B8M3_9ACTN
MEVGHRPGDAARRPHTLAPTVVPGVTDDMRIAHVEIFGPILPIFGYRHIDEGHQLRQRTTAAARALLLRRQRPRAAQGPRPHDLRQRHRHARRAGRPPLRRRRRQRDGQIPRHRRLPHTQPPQGHPRTRTLERHPHAVRPFGKRTEALLDFLPR